MKMNTVTPNAAFAVETTTDMSFGSGAIFVGGGITENASK